jgi:endonuclease YncB( thermonuclease family)
MGIHMSQKVFAGFLVLFFILCAWPEASLAQSQGVIVRALDGDSLIVKIQDKFKEIRLFGIDSPEWKQPFGKQAKSFSQGFAGKKVKVESVGKDIHGRLLGVITLKIGDCLNQLLVAKGLAWHYRHFSPDAVLAGLEAKARKTRVGLWKDDDPVPPWIWRRQKHPKEPFIEKQNTLGTLLHGNVRSQVFHQKSCKQYNCKNCTKIFRSRKEALRKGYHPCNLCRP